MTCRNHVIDGKMYIEIPATNLPFGNACRHCAFYGTACYDRTDFTCHSDARPDGEDVIFVEYKKAVGPVYPLDLPLKPIPYRIVKFGPAPKRMKKFVTPLLRQLQWVHGE